MLPPERFHTAKTHKRHWPCSPVGSGLQKSLLHHLTHRGEFDILQFGPGSWEIECNSII